MSRQGSTKELLEILGQEQKSARTAPKAARKPKKKKPRRRWWNRRRVAAVLSAGAVGCAACVLLLRWITFDPVSYARSVWEPLTVVDQETVQGLRALSRTSDPASVREAVDSLDVPTLLEREKRARDKLKTLEERYHRGPQPCARYGLQEPTTPVEEAAKEIVSAGLAGKLDELAAETSRWEKERDNRSHGADHATEILQNASAQDSLWNRLGVSVRRGATLEALQHVMRPSPAFEARHLTGEELVRAKALWTRYGSLRAAALRVARWKLNVDLTAPHLRLLRPDLTEVQASQILRVLSPESSQPWTPLDVRVSLDDQRRVLAVRWDAQGAQARVFVGDKMLVAPSQAEVVAALGQPLPLQDTESLSYDRAGFRQRILFSHDKLVAVELWRAGSPNTAP